MPSMDYIADLPTEIIGHIIDFVHPSAHLHLARSCRRLHKCSKDVLKAHRKAHEQFFVCSDVLPTTIPDLLRRFVADPMAAWHLHTLELYWERAYWCEWEPCPFTISKGTRFRGRGAPRDNCLTHDERILFLDILRKDVHFSEQDISKARDDIEAGSDAPLKLLLFALCPRLTTVKYSRDFRISGRQAFDREDGPHSTPRSSLDYLERAITLHSHRGTWPAGLSSIRNLEVGVATGSQLDQLDRRSPFHLLLDIIKLPCLLSLYWHGLSEDVGDATIDHSTVDVDEPYGMVSGSCSVQHVFIEGSGLGSPYKFRTALLAASRDLRSLAISDSQVDKPSRWFYGACITGMLCKTDNMSVHEYHPHRPDELFPESPGIVVVDAQDFFLGPYYGRKYDHRESFELHRHNSYPRYHHREWTEPFHFFTEQTKRGLLDPSVEAVVLNSLFSGFNEAAADLIDDAIVAMIAARSTHLPNLKAVYLAALEDQPPREYDGFQRPRPRQRRWFKNAIRAGCNAGIDVHTRTTRGQAFHVVDFPKPPNRAELKFVPDDVREEGPLEFDVYSGGWGPPGCGNCGKCSVCLERYDDLVWREIDQTWMR